MLTDNFVAETKALYASRPKLQAIEYHELLSIRAYTANFYSEINSGLRGFKPELKDKWKDVIDSADSGLKKLSDAGVTHKGVVQRGLELDDVTVDKLFPLNGEFSDKAFLSTSKKTDTAFPGNVKVQVLSKNGVDIEDISHYKHEKEVLFRPNSKFEVVEKTKASDGTWNIKIVEKG